MPLDIVGDGPLLEELQRATLPNVTVHGRKSREETVAMMRSAKGLTNAELDLCQALAVIPTSPA